MLKKLTIGMGRAEDAPNGCLAVSYLVDGANGPCIELDSFDFDGKNSVYFRHLVAS